MKTTDVPHDFRSFYQLFRKLEYKHDYSIVFDDFLSAMMNYFTPPNMDNYPVSLFDKYTKDERLLIGSMIPEIMQLFHQKIDTEELKWFDLFGAFYEALASRSKKSGLGQFFTPEPIVDLMTLIQSSKGEDLTGKGMTMSDPTCGSGRFLIAFQGHFPGNYTYAEDIDPICCKMTCINMMLHGCEGEVVQHNALNPDDYQRGWKINHNIRIYGLPSIIPIKKEQSTIYQMWQNQKAKYAQEKAETDRKAEEELIRTVGKQTDLFAMFDEGD